MKGGIDIKVLFAIVLSLFVVLNIYIDIVHTCAYFEFLFCKREFSKKECRNIVCRYARECEYNTVWVKE